jgi:cyclophilin family peptidyl-prolyl cis-trans isomerase
MNTTTAFSLLKYLALLIMTCMLSSCGGSDSFVPVITGVKVQSAQYGKIATIYIGGKDLRTSLTIDSNGACIQPSFASNSSTDTLVLNCEVSKVGDFDLVVKTAQGQAIYNTTLSIPFPQVALITRIGSITVELDPIASPVSVKNFLSYVNKGFYRSTLFHRVIPGFVVQGGGYSSGMVKKTDQAGPIALESNNGLSNLRGSLAMARTNLPNSATSEFYINLIHNLSLDYKNSANPGYAVFGKVVKGMDVVDAIASEPTGVLGSFSDVPLAEIGLSLALQTQ